MPGKYFNCKFCKKPVYRDLKRIHENEKNGWNVFCSQECLWQFRRKSKIYSCSRTGCNNTFIRKPSELKKIRKCYCSTHCAAIVNNSKYVKRPAVIKTCGYCKKSFKGHGKKFCSETCQNKAQIIPADLLISEIKKFVRFNKRIPCKREFSNYHAIRGRFGTWNNAIKIAGFSPNPVMFANRHIAKDGHECDSFSEKIIDDWMFENGIEHKRDVPYPGNKGFTCDFVVGNKWIEFFGLAGQHRKYDLLKRRKLSLVKRYDIDLIRLFPDDIFPKNKLSVILNV